MGEEKKKRIDDAGIVLFIALFIIIIYFISICKTFTDIIYVAFGSIFMFAMIAILYKLDKQ